MSVFLPKAKDVVGAFFPLEWFDGHSEEQYTGENTANCGNIKVARQYWGAKIPNLVQDGVTVITNRMQISRIKFIPTTEIPIEKA